MRLTLRNLLIVLFTVGMPICSASIGWAHDTATITVQGIRLVRIPAGEFRMGGDANDPLARPYELPQHAQKIASPFFMGETEVTQWELSISCCCYRLCHQTNLCLACSLLVGCCLGEAVEASGLLPKNGSLCYESLNGRNGRGDSDDEEA